jgi:hypothetical protein
MASRRVSTLLAMEKPAGQNWPENHCSSHHHLDSGDEPLWVAKNPKQPEIIHLLRLRGDPCDRSRADDFVGGKDPGPQWTESWILGCQRKPQRLSSAEHFG